VAIATDIQVQSFVDQRLRPRCEQIRALQAAMLDDLANIGDIYQAVTQPNPTWVDNRTDGPPHLMVPNDVIDLNQFLNDISNAIKNHAQWPVVQNCCVRPLM
jgi:hypothetical protein